MGGETFAMLLLAALWFGIRALISRAAKQRQSQGGAKGPGANTAKSLGGWAQMLGGMLTEEEPAKPTQPQAAPDARRVAAAFPPAPAVKNVHELNDAAYFGEFDGQESTLSVNAKAKSAYAQVSPTAGDAAFSSPVSQNIPALMQGVIFAEILTRPGERRKPGSFRRQTLPPAAPPCD